MEKIYGRTKTIQEDKVSGFCPGCMHSTVIKLIGEVLEEMELVDRAACVLGIGCCGLHMDYIAYDNTTAPHGRACAVATGMKRSNPDSLVFTYQGDGDFASIGLAESISAANRGENITVIFINNGIYGMTGGQMAPTTLVGMKAPTAAIPRSTAIPCTCVRFSTSSPRPPTWCAPAATPPPTSTRPSRPFTRPSRTNWTARASPWWRSSPAAPPTGAWIP